ncbi:MULTISPECIES: GlxA family transcriptional regulator [unclassified Nocardiopsis]|uniref:GlxA family transcriptional regulator n=1 Tax=unclassified Nocardiopsis TaxID=2649073 RepID=UPI00135704AB|nr:MULTISPECIES: helix-turn-helix domain-containing protein [unclassified Nocardiopsis]
MHTVAVLALDEVIPFDLGTPLEVFGRTVLADGPAAYRVRVCAPRPSVRAGVFGLNDLDGLDALAEADTVVVPGRSDLSLPVPEEAATALRAVVDRGGRVASICVGAFVLAEAGLLDGRRATTHWAVAELLAERYPRVRVDPNVLYVDTGRVLTSAGAAAGLDLCLHMVRADYGAAVAAEAARLSVVPLEREGGQAQFINRRPRVARDSPLAATLGWMEQNSREPLTLKDIAAHLGVSVRTLNRRFHDETGTTPITWLRHTRVRQARALLESTGHTAERIAREVGFTSPANFREAFKEVVGVSPAAYRRSFRGITPTS